jgi:hypothetical protein
MGSLDLLPQLWGCAGFWCFLRLEASSTRWVAHPSANRLRSRLHWGLVHVLAHLCMRRLWGLSVKRLPTVA